jgi:hypothetical protein
MLIKPLYQWYLIRWNLQREPSEVLWTPKEFVCLPFHVRLLLADVKIRIKAVPNGCNLYQVGCVYSLPAVTPAHYERGVIGDGDQIPLSWDDVYVRGRDGILFMLFPWEFEVVMKENHASVAIQTA